jgi:heat shock protein HslJ
MKGTHRFALAGTLLLLGVGGCSSSLEKPEAVADTGQALEKPFTASGNEPFWKVTVVPEQLVLERPGEAAEELRYTTVEQSATGHRFRASRDGLSLDLVIAPQLCRDSMTGMPHPRQARLSLNGEQLSGCGGDPKQLIMDTEWVVETVGGRSTVDESRATIEFLPEGRIAGDGSCNRYSGQWSLNGETLEVGQLAVTRMACEPALMDQEDRFLRHLQSARSFDISHRGGLLLSSEGQVAISASRAAR